MQKIFILLGLLITIPATATTMCTANDTVAIVLDPSLPGSGGKTDAIGWYAYTEYGTISGIHALLDRKGDALVAVSNLTINGKRVLGGERIGNYCWCKMTHPAISQWVYVGEPVGYIGGGTCPGLCVYKMQYEERMRKSLFGSISN